MPNTPTIPDLAAALSSLRPQAESSDSELLGFTVDQHSDGLGAAKHGSHYSHSSHSSSVY